MAYYIDLSKITLDEYKAKLASAYLPPSRMILKEQLDERFDYFKSIGIKNVSALLNLLKQKKPLLELQKIDILSGNYLNILLREIKSTLPKPNRMSEFPGISENTVSKLEQLGIKNTMKIFDRVRTSQLRNELARKTGISASELLELTKLSDLSRIKWVGATFARMLYDLDIDTVEKVTKADPVDLHRSINQLNKEKSIYKGQIGLNDIRIFIDAAKDVPLDIEY